MDVQGAGSAQLHLQVGDGGLVCTTGTCVLFLDAGVTLSARPRSENLGFETWLAPAPCDAGPDCTFVVTAAATHTARFAAFNRVFVTSGKIAPGALGGRDGGDTFCTAHARDAGLSGTYLAYLNTDSEESDVRFAPYAGWARLDGKPVFSTMARSILVGSLYPPILDERGRRLVTDGGARGIEERVATGGYGPGSNCAGWTRLDAGTAAAGLTYNALFYDDFNALDFTCGEPARLYCLGIERSVQVVLPTPAARLAFRTRAQFIPGGGLQAADNLCNAEAQAADLPPRFVALLGAPNSTAPTRLDAGSGWARVDGVYWIPDAGAFFAGHPDSLASSLALDAWGNSAPGDPSVWTGFALGRAPSAHTATETCNTWMSNSSAFSGFFGTSAHAQLPDLVPATLRTCDAVGHHLICMEK